VWDALKGVPYVLHAVPDFRYVGDALQGIPETTASVQEKGPAKFAGPFCFSVRGGV